VPAARPHEASQECSHPVEITPERSRQPVSVLGVLVGDAGFDSRLVEGSGSARPVFGCLARARRTGRRWNGAVRWNRRIDVRLSRFNVCFGLCEVKSRNLNLDTFFFACSRLTKTQDLEDGLFAIEDGAEPAFPVEIFENVNGFSPFVLSGLYSLIVGVPSESEISESPILGTLLTDEEKQPNAQPAKRLLFAACSKHLDAIVVAGCIYDHRLETGIPGCRVKVSFLDNNMEEVPDRSRMVETLSNGIFFFRTPATIDAAHVVVSANDVHATVPIVRISARRRMPRVAAYVKKIELVSDRIAREISLTMEEADDLLKEARNEEINRKVLEEDPVRLPILFLASPPQKRWAARTYGIQLNVDFAPSGPLWREARLSRNRSTREFSARRGRPCGR